MYDFASNVAQKAVHNFSRYHVLLLNSWTVPKKRAAVDDNNYYYYYYWHAFPLAIQTSLFGWSFALSWLPLWDNLEASQVFFARYLAANFHSAMTSAKWKGADSSRAWFDTMRPTKSIWATKCFQFEWIQTDYYDSCFESHMFSRSKCLSGNMSIRQICYKIKKSCLYDLSSNVT